MIETRFSDLYFLKRELDSLDWSDFTEAYITESCRPFEPLLLTETKAKLADRKLLKLATDAGRQLRSKDDVDLIDWEIRRGWADPIKFGKGYKIIEYSVLSDPSKENKIHHGYVVYFASNRKVREVWCDCKDFFYRLYFLYVKAGISTYDLDSAYSRFMVGEVQKRPPEITNPGNRLFVCKHLLHIFDNILDLGKYGKILADVDEFETEKAQEIEKQIKQQLKTPEEETPESDEETEPEKPLEKEVKPEKEKDEEDMTAGKDLSAQKKSLGRAISNALKSQSSVPAKKSPVKPTLNSTAKKILK